MNRFRAIAAGITLLALVLVVAAGLDTRRLVGQVFPGFLVFDLNQPGDTVPQQLAVVAPRAPAYWPEPGTAVPPRATVLSVDDHPVASSAAVYATVAAKAAGTAVRYQLQGSYGIHTVTVAARIFNDRDWLNLFVPNAIVVGAFVLVALFAMLRWSDDPLTPLLAGVAGVVALEVVADSALMIAGPLTPIWLQLFMVSFCFLPAVLLHWTLVVPAPVQYARWRYVGYAVSFLLLIMYDAASYYLPTDAGNWLRIRAFFVVASFLGTTALFASGRYLVADWSAYGRHAWLLRGLGFATGVTCPGVLFYMGGIVSNDPRWILGWLTFAMFAALLMRQRMVLQTAPAFTAHVAPFERAASQDNVPVDATPGSLVVKASLVRALEGNPHPDTGVAIFRQEGEYWSLTYKGRTVHLKDMIGMHYIAELLRHPGEQIPASVLAAARRGMPADGMSNGDIAAEGLRVSSDPNGSSAAADFLLDDRARQDYRKRLDELRAELAECESQNDIGRVDALRGEIELLTEQLTTSIRRDKHGVGNDNVRLSVTKTIKAALGKIGDNHPELHHHLNSHIRTGRTCVYTPDPTARVRWDV